ncbi:MAG: hypothetical protein Kow002_21420 [Anaerolineales bacterium]
MENKKISYWWSALVGFLSIAAQVASFYNRFGKLAPAESNLLDFLWFFLGGLAGGAIGVYFYNRNVSNAARWAVMVSFVLGFYPAMLAMLGGGLIGFIGIIILPAIVWGIFTGLGFLLGKLLQRKK